MDNPAARSAHILLQTEHPEHLQNLRTQLEAIGHQVTVADGRDQVLSLLSCDKFDLLMLDAEHLDIIRTIRGEKACNAPIITLARLDELEMAEESLGMGAQDYLLEPFKQTVLNIRVAGALEQRWAKQNQDERERLLKLEHDMEIARRIQYSFLPRELPQVDRWEFEARFYPARIVAGDWYDAFYLTNRRRVGFVIADVCDKGLPSALFMALCRSLIRAFSQQNQSLSWMDTSQFQAGDWLKFVTSNAKAVKGGPAAAQLAEAEAEERQRNLPSAGTTQLKSAVNLTNKYVIENHAESNMFATMFFGVLDPQTGIFSYINAGHNAPVVIDPAGQIKSRLKPSGPALGIVNKADFKIRSLEIDPGDTLFLFTDGVPDAASPEGQHFTEKRLMELIQRPNLTASSIMNLVQNTIHEHTNKAVQFDDVTMVAIHRKV